MEGAPGGFTKEMKATEEVQKICDQVCSAFLSIFQHCAHCMTLLLEHLRGNTRLCKPQTSLLRDKTLNDVTVQ